MDFQLENGKLYCWQWDVRQKILIQGIEDFGLKTPVFLIGNPKDKKGLYKVLISEENDVKYIPVPDEILQKEGCADIYLYDEETGTTILAWRFTIKRKEKPMDYVYEETNFTTLTELELKVNNILDNTLPQLSKDLKEYTIQQIEKAELDDIQLDETLTLKGRAADSKAVGTRIAEVEEAIGDASFVSYNEQKLTDEQKAQARENIGAAKAAEINRTFVVDYALPLKLTLPNLGIYGKTLVSGTARFADIEIIDDATFLYKINTLCFDDCDNIVLTFNDNSTDNSVTIIPATSIYYETDFADGVFDKVTSGSAWEERYSDNDINNENSKFQDDGAIGKGHYGYDSTYEDDAYLSDGSSWFVEGAGVENTTVIFSFKGTGFDIISRTGELQGFIRVSIYTDEARTELYKGVTVLNKSESGLELYQIPVASVNELPYGTYYVTIGVNAAYSNSNYPMLSRGGEFYFDAIRIYDPANNGKDNNIIQEAYKQDSEAWPVYRNLSSSKISADDFNNLDDDTPVDNIIFIDSNYQVSTYTGGAGLLLGPGESIAFSLDLDGLQDDLTSVQIGLKSAYETGVDYKIFDGEFVEFKNDLNKIPEKAIKTCTDMYYNINQYKEGLIVIQNSSKNDKILIPTTLKMTFNRELDNASIKFKTSKSAIDKLVKSLRAEIATVGLVEEKIDIATDDEIISILIEEDMLPGVVDSDGAILSDENENILLW